MAGGIVYGSLYMIAVGIWFYIHGLGFNAVYVALPGWLGFAIPSLIKFIEYRRQPMATEIVLVDISDEERSSVLGWAGITLACWIVNILLLGSNTFLSVIWAWMPTFGLLTWPLMTIGTAWMIKNLKAIVPATE